MSTDNSVSVRRIVIVHGPADDELVDVLTSSGLEVAIDTGRITIWAPVTATPDAGTDARALGPAPGRT